MSLENIWVEAATAWNEAESFSEKKLALLPYQELEYDITFSVASHLDRTYFNKTGGFWRYAYGNPHDGDRVYLDGQYVGIATNCGLLTFSLN